MALVCTLSFLQKDNSSRLVVLDATGEYNASTNTYGWRTATSGGTNMTLTAVTTATLVIESAANGISETLDLTDTAQSYGLNWSAAEPEHVLFNIYAADLGLTATGVIPDGVYRFTYTVSDGVSTVVTRRVVALSAQKKCCLFNMIKQLHANHDCDDCTDTYFQNIVKAWALVKALDASAYCGLETEYQDILDMLDVLCDYENCGCN